MILLWKIKIKKKIICMLDRKFTFAKDYLNYLIKKDKHIKELIKEIKIINWKSSDNFSVTLYKN